MATPVPQLRDYSWLGGALQVEGARVTSDGTYTRPKVMIGVPSESMKSWMNSAGLNAEQCLLPMVRARARVSAEGEASGVMCYTPVARSSSPAAGVQGCRLH